MCANYELMRARMEEAQKQFGLTRVLFTELRDDGYYPKQQVPIIGANAEGDRAMVSARWGLIPNSYSDPNQHPQPFNIRAETITSNVVASECFESRRCIIPATAFFEWTAAAPKTRYRLSLSDGSLMGIAGLYDVWESSTAQVITTTMVTTKPNDMIGRFHHRMPVILTPDDYATWLDVDTPASELLKLLKSYPSDHMACADAPRWKATQAAKPPPPTLFDGERA